MRAVLHRLALILPLILLVTVGIRYVAGHGVALVEARLSETAQSMRRAAGADWARIEVDGLRVAMRGKAPDPAARARLAAALARAMPLSVIVDRTTLGAPDAARVAPLRVELLRDPAGITVIGHVPAGAVRAELLIALADAFPGAAIEDLSRTGQGVRPEDWGAALSVALAALEALPESTAVIEPGRVRIEGQMPAIGPRRVLVDRLRQVAGPSLTLDLAIAVPRRAILPFRLAVERDETAQGTQRTVLIACAARDEREA
ncbi:MAG: hypothetical protein AAGF76_03210, partial [Pseudomonadota bacterium]